MSVLNIKSPCAVAFLFFLLPGGFHVFIRDSRASLATQASPKCQIPIDLCRAGIGVPDAQATCVVLFRSAGPQKRPTSGPPFLETNSSRENTPPEGGERQNLLFSFTRQKRVHTLILKQSCVLGYQACAGRSRLGWEPFALD